MVFFSLLSSLFSAQSMIHDGISKVTRPGVTSQEILKQVNLTAEALKKPKKCWTDSESSEFEGNIIIMF